MNRRHAPWLWVGTDDCNHASEDLEDPFDGDVLHQRGGTLRTMSETQRRLTLTPAHLVRFGTGPEAIEVRARGFGIVLSSLGFFRVWRSLSVVVFRQLTRDRCRGLFVGLHGVSWVSTPLPPSAHASVPALGPLRTPLLPSMQALPSLRVQLTVTPPAPPEGLP